MFAYGCGVQEKVEAPGVLEVSGATGATVADAAAGPEAAARFEPEPSADQVALGTLEVGAEGSAVAEAAAGPSAKAAFNTEPASSTGQARSDVAWVLCLAVEMAKTWENSQRAAPCSMCPLISLSCRCAGAGHC